MEKWKRIGCVGLTTLAVAFAGCNTVETESGETEKLQVIATTSLLCDLTEKIAQDTVTLNCLIEPGTNPHSYEPTPSDRAAIDQAQLILYGGYQLEAKMIALIESTSSTIEKIAIYEQAVPNPLLGEHHEHHHDEEHNHEEEEVNTEEELVSDPHVWHDAENGIKIVQSIAENLENLAPENAQLYQQNAAELTERLTEIDTWISDQIATIPIQQRKLVTTHDAFGYYAQAYGLEVEPIQGISSETKPSAARLKEIVGTVKQAEVPTIFAEATTNPSVLETISREANVNISKQPLYAAGPGSKGSEVETYAEMLIANTRAIVEGLGGEYSPL
ncbi:metal ABC transporter substrate-binding protein [Oscillatoria salina]|uniref:metal ABC transporter substrate-binding protein n=1 Tax=Oscillatoria salina TaxID=331517 RepID=UPI001CCDB6BF|nr:metal ABC transporter substrate-binding protein [Oscillatoria salina]MBZ8181448.1 zinc ABC transporter substrate-binding protein [Oscillatoria salina IIICB1]